MREHCRCVALSRVLWYACVVLCCQCLSQLLSMVPANERISLRYLVHPNTHTHTHTYTHHNSHSEEQKISQRAHPSLSLSLSSSLQPSLSDSPSPHSPHSIFGVYPFFIEKGTHTLTHTHTHTHAPKKEYVLDAPTTNANLMRVLRAMQLNKPILLEVSE